MFRGLQVHYDATGFLEKNRDNLSSSIRDVMIGSEDEFIKDLFMASLSQTGCLSRTQSSIRRGTEGRRSGGIRRYASNDKSKGTVRGLAKKKRRNALGEAGKTNTNKRAQPTIATFYRVGFLRITTL